MLDSICHMPLKLLKIHIFGQDPLKRQDFANFCARLKCKSSLNVTIKSVNHLWFIVLFQRQHHVITIYKYFKV